MCWYNEIILLQTYDGISVWIVHISEDMKISLQKKIKNLAKMPGSENQAIINHFITILIEVFIPAR